MRPVVHCYLLQPLQPGGQGPARNRPPAPAAIAPTERPGAGFGRGPELGPELDPALDPALALDLL